MSSDAAATPWLGDAAGRAALRRELARDPRNAINELQRSSALGAHSAILALLDLHKVPRGHVYKSLFEHLRDKLVATLPAMTHARYGHRLVPRQAAQSGQADTFAVSDRTLRYPHSLTKLLDATFPYLENADLQPVVLEVLRRHGELPEDKARWLLEHEAVFKQCPIEVKRQVWRQPVGQRSLRQHLLPLIDTYMNDPVLMAAARDYRRSSDAAAAGTPVSKTRCGLRRQRAVGRRASSG